MKKSILFLFSIVTVLSLSSCWEFNRQQRIKNAEAEGIALFQQSENEKKVLIEQARAENEAAELQATAKIKIAQAEAQAEIERAKGVAEANRIIGNSLKGNSEYLEYLKIDNIRHSQGEKIYIPTEALLPITEAK